MAEAIQLSQRCAACEKNVVVTSDKVKQSEVKHMVEGKATRLRLTYWQCECGATNVVQVDDDATKKKFYECIKMIAAAAKLKKHGQYQTEAQQLKSIKQREMLKEMRAALKKLYEGEYCTLKSGELVQVNFAKEAEPVES